MWRFTLLFGVLFLVGCEPSTASFDGKADVGRSFAADIYRVQYGGHSYLVWNCGNAMAIVHDEDCSCKSIGFSAESKIKAEIMQHESRINDLKNKLQGEVTGEDFSVTNN